MTSYPLTYRMVFIVGGFGSGAGTWSDTRAPDRKTRRRIVVMTAGTNGNGHSGAAGGAAAGSHGIFDHAAPAGHAKKTSEVLVMPEACFQHDIVWLMSQSQLHKQFFISDLEWLVMTPVLLGQFRLFYDQQKPIGVVFWAHASTEVAERLAQGVTRLRPQDWKSGEELWVVEVMAPFGGADEMVKDLKAKVFPGRALKVLALEGGRHGVKVV